MPVSLVVFDLAGTTVVDENYVTGCLWRAAQEFELPTTEQEIAHNIGTNKRHLYRWLIGRSQGRELDLQDMGTCTLDEAGETLADTSFARYEELMIQTYREECREVPGTTQCFEWLKERGIRVATDTGFHGAINAAIFERLGWLRSGLVDVSVHVGDVPGERGRPAPYMIFHAMQALGLTRMRDVIKVGDQPADLLEGDNAGCGGIIGVLSGNLTAAELGRFRHTHLIPSVADLPAVLERDFL